MSTSDSDYSIDWLASDEDDYDSPNRSSPQQAEEPPVPPSSSSLRESPTSCFHCRATQRRRRMRRRSGCTDGGPDSPAAACSELRCYLQPLSSILQGLRAGRYSERLSSFQESVAMDRIQRIMGVLQNPDMGGRFLSILLKIEEMLQSWFPHVKLNVTQTDDSPAAKTQKQHPSSASPPPSSPRSLSSDVESPLASSHSSTHLKWLHKSPICSLKTPESSLSLPAWPASPPPARCSQEMTQDNAVSSTSDLHSGPLLRLPTAPHLSRGPLPFKISSPCLERLLQAKESIITPRMAGDGGWPS
uniref:uncharacterized protein n=1 Tax=Semicossyphus pulcher TaxID=241346 RepID=UPI0037E99B17